MPVISQDGTHIEVWTEGDGERGEGERRGERGREGRGGGKGRGKGRGGEEEIAKRREKIEG